MGKPTTSRISYKKYKCTTCGHVSSIQTNHYGECYPRCKKCGWKHPFEMGQRHVCLEPVPKDMNVPKPWKMVKLGDIMEVKKR